MERTVAWKKSTILGLNDSIHLEIAIYHGLNYVEIACQIWVDHLQIHDPE